MQAAEVPPAQTELLLGKHDDAAPLGGLVGERGELRRVGQLVDVGAVDGDQLVRLPVAEGDGARLVEQQGVHVARRLHGAAAHRKDVGLVEAAHARDADGGEQRADRGGREADEQGDQRGHRGGIGHPGLAGGEGGKGIEGDGDEQKDDRQSDEQDLQRDLVGGLLAGGALDHRDHLVQKALTRLACDADDELVGGDGGAAGDRAAVAARFADDRRGFAGDGTFIHRGRTVDHLAVGGDLFAHADEDEVALPEAGALDAGDFVPAVGGGDFVGGHVLSGGAQRVGLRLAAPFGDRLGEVGEEDGEPEDDRHGEDKAGARVRYPEEGADIEGGGQDRRDIDEEHDRVAQLGLGGQLDEGVLHRPEHQLFCDKGRLFLIHEVHSFKQSSGRTLRWVRARAPGRSSARRRAGPRRSAAR